MKNNAEIKNIFLNENRDAVVILDQTQLPNRTAYLEINNLKDSYEAILQLKVRGAPAIGIFAAYALAVEARRLTATITDTTLLLSKLQEAAAYLNSARPTAVNLSWALKRMCAYAETLRTQQPLAVADALIAEGEKIQAEDVSMCYKIAQYGLSLLRKDSGILTHCNAGPLATSRYGTALGPILLGQEKSYNFHVFADETRPLLQGARLTAYELAQAGVDVTLICDNMASIVMKSGKIQACLVGCDRVSAAGDAANKIGTSGVAILAKYYGIPFYVLGPSSTIDFNCATGDDIKIELRPDSEITSKFYQKPMAPENVRCYNPAFDVTDHSLISAIITERGIVYPPYRENLAKLFSDRQADACKH